MKIDIPLLAYTSFYAVGKSETRFEKATVAEEYAKYATRFI